MLPGVIYRHSSVFLSKVFNINLTLKYRDYSKIPLDLIIKIPRQCDDYMLHLENRDVESVVGNLDKNYY